MRAVAEIVHVSFRRVERAADWLTGAAGPVFIAICVTLVVGGIWTFFSTMFLQLAPLPTELANLFHTYSPAHIALGLIPTLLDSTTKDTVPTLRFFFWLSLCLFTVYSIAWHYCMACTVPPGTVCDGLADAVPERRSGPGSNIWWARYRSRAARASGPKLHDLKSAQAHVLTHEPPEAAAPVRISSVADLNKLSTTLNGMEGTTTSSATLSASRSSSDRTLPLRQSSLPSSHRSSTSSESGTPRIPRSDLPFSIHDLDPVAIASPSPLDTENSALPNPIFPGVSRHSHDTIRHHSPVPHTTIQDEEDQYDLDQDDEDLFPLAGMCRKCPTIPLVKALTVLPPELRKVEKQIRANAPAQTFTSKLGPEDIDEGEAEVRAWLGSAAAEKLVAPPKPERAHHCRTCKTCTLKFDHHCPWLNQCVGLGNERYFVLFMAWLSFGCGVVLWAGWPVVRASMRWGTAWEYDYTPRVFVMLLYILALVMGLALGVMAAWQIILVARGETSVESQDNAHYRELAKKRGQEFLNVYDIGWRRNLELFFNVGPGSPYRWYTVLLPMRIPPYSDGWHYAKRRGLNGKHAGIELQEQLTDEEFEDDYYDPQPARAKTSTGAPKAS